MSREPDTSDKLEGESWADYWNRKRREYHGDKCDCYVCYLARIDKREKDEQN